MNRLEELLGPTLFKAWLLVVSLGVVAWSIHEIATTIRLLFL